jgi:hypothetical protein
VLGDEDFDFPDFLVSDEVFEGLNAEDMTVQRKSMMEMIKDMSMGQKVKLAMMGNMEVRKILIKDPRRQIAISVLANARITEKEIVSIASDAADCTGYNRLYCCREVTFKKLSGQACAGEQSQDTSENFDGTA